MLSFLSRLALGRQGSRLGASLSGSATAVGSSCLLSSGLQPGGHSPVICAAPSWPLFLALGPFLAHASVATVFSRRCSRWSGETNCSVQPVTSSKLPSSTGHSYRTQHHRPVPGRDLKGILRCPQSFSLASP